MMKVTPFQLVALVLLVAAACIVFVSGDSDAPIGGRIASRMRELKSHLQDRTSMVLDAHLLSVAATTTGKDKPEPMDIEPHPVGAAETAEQRALRLQRQLEHALDLEERQNDGEDEQLIAAFANQNINLASEQVQIRGAAIADADIAAGALALHQAFVAAAAAAAGGAAAAAVGPHRRLLETTEFHLNVVESDGADEETVTTNMVELEAEVIASVFPLTALGTVLTPNVGTMRVATRGAADPAIPFGGFTYLFAPAAAGAAAPVQGRVVRARGNILIPVGVRPQNHQRVADWCDVLYKNPMGPPFIGCGTCRDGVAGGGRRLIQSGHIIAWSLGGDSTDPINFYPQHRTSNLQSGRWGKVEAIALRVKAICLLQPVHVDITFTAFSANGGYPTAGTYQITTNAACVALLAAANGAVGCAGAAGGNANSYIRTFCRWSVAAGGGRAYGTPFTNGPNDRILGLVPAAIQAMYFP